MEFSNAIGIAADHKKERGLGISDRQNEQSDTHSVNGVRVKTPSSGKVTEEGGRSSGGG